MSFKPIRYLLCAAAVASLAACGGRSEESAETTNEVAIEAETPVAAPASANPTVGGAEMFPDKTIVENASKSADHTTLVAAVKAADLVETLSGPGPFTVFAPTNTAFEKLPAGAVEGLLKPEAKKDLAGVLTYHVVSGRMTAADLSKAIKDGGGTAKLTTVAGGPLTATQLGSTITLTDAKGGKSTVTQADVMQSNGVVHVIDTVLMPAA